MKVQQDIALCNIKAVNSCSKNFALEKICCAFSTCNNIFDLLILVAITKFTKAAKIISASHFFFIPLLDKCNNSFFYIITYDSSKISSYVQHALYSLQITASITLDLLTSLDQRESRLVLSQNICNSRFISVALDFRQLDGACLI